MLEGLVGLSERGTNPTLERFLVTELDAQARSNPEVMARLKVRVDTRGGDFDALRRKIQAARRETAGLPARPRKATRAAAGGASPIEEAAEELDSPNILDLGGKGEKGEKDDNAGKAGKGDKKR